MATSAVDDLTFKEDMELEELLNIVITATRTPQSLEEAPSVVGVITARDIRRHGYRTVGEALRSVQGIAIINDHVHWNVGVRGLYSAPGSANDILGVMINGQSASFRPTSENSLGHELVPIKAVKRIEIVRGPGAALYGAKGFLAVINVITFGDDAFSQEPPTVSVTVDGYYTASEHNQAMNGGISFSSMSRHDAFQYAIFGTYYYADRSGLAAPGRTDIVQWMMHKQYPDAFADRDGYPSPGWDAGSRQRLLNDSPSKGDLERVGSLYGTASYSLGDTIRVSADSNFQYFDRYGEFQEYSYLTHRTRLAHINGFARLRFTHGQDGDSGFRFKASATAASGRPTGKDQIVDPSSGGFGKRRRFGYTAFDTILEASYAAGHDNIFTLGLDDSCDMEDLLTLEVYNLATGETFPQPDPGEKVFHNVGVYLQWIWSPVDYLRFTFGSRLDHNSQIACDSRQWDCLGSVPNKEVPATARNEAFEISHQGLIQVSNRGGLVYSLPVGDTYAKLLYGSSFKPPSPFQLHHEPLTTNASRGSQYLLPQTADTYEIQVGGEPIDDFRFSLGAFYTSVNDFVMYLKEGSAFQSRNADVTLSGFEGSVDYEFGSNLSFYWNMNLMLSQTMSPKQTREESDLAWVVSEYNTKMPVGMYPALIVSGGMNVALPDQHINVNVNWQYVGERGASPMNNQLYSVTDLQDTYSLDSYFVANATISSMGLDFLGSGTETVISASLRNVPGSYVEAGHGGIDIPGLGPSLHLQVEQRL